MCLFVFLNLAMAVIYCLSISPHKIMIPVLFKNTASPKPPS